MFKFQTEAHRQPSRARTAGPKMCRLADLPQSTKSLNQTMVSSKLFITPGKAADGAEDFVAGDLEVRDTVAGEVIAVGTVVNIEVVDVAAAANTEVDADVADTPPRRADQADQADQADREDQEE